MDLTNLMDELNNIAIDIEEQYIKKETELIMYLSNFDCEYDHIEDKKIFDIVYDLFVNNTVHEITNTHTIVLRMIGIYYYTKKDYRNMKAFYLLAIDDNDIISMINLGTYYKNIYADSAMFYFYMLALKHGSILVLPKLGHYYFTKNDINNMKTYYDMAISEKNICAISYINNYLEDAYDISYASKHMNILNLNNKYRYCLY